MPPPASVSDIYVENAGERYQVATLKQFKEFRDLVTSTENWKEKYNTEKCKVYTRVSETEGAGAGLNIVKVDTVMEVDPHTVYDALHDPDFRRSWDANMIDGYNICQLDARNDVGYYAAKFPFPMSNRDFVNQRSWMEFDNGDFIIMNHSVFHPDKPESKKFVRAQSIISGYYLKPLDKGHTQLLYLTHSDIKASLPHSLLNKITQSFAPGLMTTLEKNSNNYITWSKENRPPSWKAPWRTPKVPWDAPVGTGPAASLVEERGEGADGSRALTASGSATMGANGSAANNGGGQAAEVHELQKQLEGVRAELAKAQHKGPADLSLAPVAPRNSDDPAAVQQYRAVMDSTCSFVDRQFVEEGRVPSLEEYLLRVRSVLDGMRRTPQSQVVASMAA